ncbi:MAG: prepilin-type N-terminal cleavage/methylation domain-containing protein [Candidatus Moraniibacteriota bacterium]
MSFRTKQSAFSLLEVVMAMAAFTIIMLGTIQIMAQGSKSYRGTKAIQTSLESAQFALNTMAKELRTSSVVSWSTGATTDIIFFDYSQNRCVQYFVNLVPGTLSKRTHTFANADPNVNRASCAAYGFGAEALQIVVSDVTNRALRVDPSTPMPNPHVGRVTLTLQVGGAGAEAIVQTTVSLRDFNYIGI